MATLFEDYLAIQKGKSTRSTCCGSRKKEKKKNDICSPSSKYITGAMLDENITWWKKVKLTQDQANGEDVNKAS